MTLFKPAQRTQKKLRLAIDGPSGSGKTYSALLIAKGLASGDLSKVAVIDTEHGSASMYADLGAFAAAEMHAPYSVEKYVAALDAAAQEGFEVVIVDSLTHAWSGEGGILDVVDRIAKTKTSGNSFAAWKEGTPLQKKLTDALLSSPCHVIATMRTKTEYVVEENDRGRKVPRKVGLAPEQRKDFEYDMDLVLDVTREHLATASKDRTAVWAERMETPTVAHGTELLEWLGSAAPQPPRPTRQVQRDQDAETPRPLPVDEPDGNGHITKSQARRLHEMLLAKGKESAWFLARLKEKKDLGDGEHLTSLPADQFDRLCEIVSGFDDPPTIAEAREAAQEPESAPPAAEEPEDASDDLDAADRAFLDETAGNGKKKPPEPSGKKGTITGPQLTRLGALCSDLEAEGMGRDEWRLWMFEEEKVVSRKELSKTAAVRVIDALSRQLTNLRAGVEAVA